MAPPSKNMPLKSIYNEYTSDEMKMQYFFQKEQNALHNQPEADKSVDRKL